MNFEIIINGNIDIERETDELLSFIRESRIPKFSVRKKELPPKKEDLGSDTLQIITAVLSAPIVTTVVKELIEIFKSYFESKREGVIKIKDGKRMMEITYKNINDTKLVDEFVKLLETGSTKKEEKKE